MHLFPIAGPEEWQLIDQPVKTDVLGREFLVLFGEIIEDRQVLGPVDGSPLRPRAIRLEDLALEVESLVVWVGHCGVLQGLKVVFPHFLMVEGPGDDHPTEPLELLLVGYLAGFELLHLLLELRLALVQHLAEGVSSHDRAEHGVTELMVLELLAVVDQHVLGEVLDLALVHVAEQQRLSRGVRAEQRLTLVRLEDEVGVLEQEAIAERSLHREQLDVDGLWRRLLEGQKLAHVVREGGLERCLVRPIYRGPDLLSSERLAGVINERSRHLVCVL